MDTAQALQVKEPRRSSATGIAALLAVLKRRAIEFKHTPTIGRTHGIHAEPTTFGLKLLNWYAEMERNLARFDAAAEDMRVGKLSGAVGTFGHLKPEHEERICERLGLKPAPVATQVIQRDRHAAYISTLAIIGSTLDKIAVEVRHLQRTEVREAQEYFSEKQKGSSAMPHKKNPITSEQISGLARVLRGNAQAAFENIALWHERDISHSSVERVIFPDSTILVDYLLAKTTDLIDRLLVYPERMKKNLESTGGLIFSGQLLLDLAEAGMLREDAYRLVQSHAMRAWKEDLIFRDEVARDAAITKLLTRRSWRRPSITRGSWAMWTRSSSVCWGSKSAMSAASRNAEPNFDSFAAPFIGLPVSHVWQGYGSAIFLEFGRTQTGRRRDGSPGNPRGEWSLMIQWSWRIEGKRRIWCGSSSDRTRWPKHLGGSRERGSSQCPYGEDLRRSYWGSRTDYTYFR